ncbi:MAG: hypothetical protein K0Q90_1188 [Paenibacillaceae bacterium]|jgi:hypothetical protein|nr:hypothetical protein [Paenibacillaceae bacterium]
MDTRPVGADFPVGARAEMRGGIIQAMQKLKRLVEGAGEEHPRVLRKLAALELAERLSKG